MAGIIKGKDPDNREVQHANLYMKISCLMQRIEELERLNDMLLEGHCMEGEKRVMPNPEGDRLTGYTERCISKAK